MRIYAILPLICLLWFSAAPAATFESQGGTLIVVVAGADSVVLVDPAHPSDLQRIQTRKHPQDVVLSPDAKLAYIAEMGTMAEPGSTVAVLELQSRTIVRRLELRPATLPHLLVLSRDGRTLWAACAPQNTIVEVDIPSGTVRHMWDTQQKGSYLFAVPPDEKRIYVANFDEGTASVIYRSGGITKVLPIGGQPIGIDASPDGREVWVCSFHANTITIISTTSDEIVQQIPAAGRDPARLKFTADGKQVYVAMSASDELVGFDVVTRHVVRRITTGKFSKGLLILPDARRAFVSAMDEGRVADVDLTSGRVSQWITTGNAPEGSVWVANSGRKGR